MDQTGVYGLAKARTMVEDSDGLLRREGMTKPSGFLGGSGENQKLDRSQPTGIGANNPSGALAGNRRSDGALCRGAANTSRQSAPGG